jgi:hypothetical protein
MQRRRFNIVLLSGAGLCGVGVTPAQAASLSGLLSDGDAASGIRAALERGAESAVGLLGKPDGFLGNPKVKIPLPGVLKKASKLLKATGQGAAVDELITAMNRAAEAAVPQAKQLLLGAVRTMSVDDGRKILTGGDRSVTDFFSAKTREPLGVKFLPIVTQATEKVELADKYNAVAGQAVGLGLLDKKDANVQQYVTAKALDGLYFMIGEEERKIRKDPVGTGSDILKKVFGSLK